MALKDKGVIKRAIVTPDKHFPLHDVKSINDFHLRIKGSMQIHRVNPFQMNDHQASHLNFSLDHLFNVC